jgi:hypothetical protein
VPGFTAAGESGVIDYAFVLDLIADLAFRSFAESEKNGCRFSMKVDDGMVSFSYAG